MYVCNLCVVEFGPLYTHLGIAENEVEVAKLIAGNMGLDVKDVKVIPITYCQNESIDENGCPYGKITILSLSLYLYCKVMRTDYVLPPLFMNHINMPFQTFSLSKTFTTTLTFVCYF